jgi:catechol 2,3-dioxygenase-like lactoylglutathione lyase family enzyme
LAIKITGVDHTSYTVTSLERSLEFYVELLGFEVVWQREITNEYFRAIVGIPNCVVRGAQLRIPASTQKLELFEYAEPRVSTPVASTNSPGSSHMALLVDDLPAMYEDLKGKGVQFRSEPVLIDAGANKGGYAVYMLDPDGIAVELFQRPSGH